MQIEEQERELVAARAAQVQAKARGEEAGKKLKQLKAQEEKLRKQREVRWPSLPWRSATQADYVAGAG